MIYYDHRSVKSKEIDMIVITSVQAEKVQPFLTPTTSASFLQKNCHRPVVSRAMVRSTQLKLSSDNMVQKWS